MKVKDMFDVAGKVAFVTGGGYGLGKTIAEAFGEAGARLVIYGRNKTELLKTQAQFHRAGFECLIAVGDITNSEDVQQAIQLTLEKFGQIDILVNNAGQNWSQPAEEMDLDKWQKIIEVNLTGMFLVSQQIGRHMIERGQGGRIINLASVAGLPGLGPEAIPTIGYNTSKAGVIGFTRSLAKEWGRWNILVNAIAPSWLPTPMIAKVLESKREQFEAITPLSRIGTLQEIKGVAVFLAAPASSYITGQTIVMDGGLTL